MLLAFKFKLLAEGTWRWWGWAVNLKFLFASAGHIRVTNDTLIHNWHHNSAHNKMFYLHQQDSHHIHKRHLTHFFKALLPSLSLYELESSICTSIPPYTLAYQRSNSDRIPLPALLLYHKSKSDRTLSQTSGWARLTAIYDQGGQSVPSLCCCFDILERHWTCWHSHQHNLLIGKIAWTAAHKHKASRALYLCIVGEVQNKNHPQLSNYMAWKKVRSD